MRYALAYPAVNRRATVYRVVTRASAVSTIPPSGSPYPMVATGVPMGTRSVRHRTGTAVVSPIRSSARSRGRSSATTSGRNRIDPVSVCTSTDSRRSGSPAVSATTWAFVSTDAPMLSTATVNPVPTGTKAVSPSSAGRLAQIEWTEGRTAPAPVTQSAGGGASDSGAHDGPTIVTVAAASTASTGRTPLHVIPTCSPRLPIRRSTRPAPPRSWDPTANRITTAPTITGRVSPPQRPPTGKKKAGRPEDRPASVYPA